MATKDRDATAQAKEQPASPASPASFAATLPQTFVVFQAKVVNLNKKLMAVAKGNKRGASEPGENNKTDYGTSDTKQPSPARLLSDDVSADHIFLTKWFAPSQAETGQTVQHRIELVERLHALYDYVTNGVVPESGGGGKWAREDIAGEKADSKGTAASSRGGGPAEEPSPEAERRLQSKVLELMSMADRLAIRKNFAKSRGLAAEMKPELERLQRRLFKLMSVVDRLAAECNRIEMSKLAMDKVRKPDQEP